MAVEFRPNVLQEQLVDVLRADVIVAVRGQLLERVLLLDLREYVHILPGRGGDAATVAHTVVRRLLARGRVAREAGSLVAAAVIAAKVSAQPGHLLLILLLVRRLVGVFGGTTFLESHVLGAGHDGLGDLDLRVILAPEPLEVVPLIVNDLLQSLFDNLNSVHHLLDLLHFRVQLLHVVADRRPLLQHLLEQFSLHLLRLIIDESSHHHLIGVYFFELSFIIIDDRCVVVLVDALERGEKLKVLLACHQ